MLFNPKIVSLVLAASVTIITVSFLSLFKDITAIHLFVTGVLCFSSGFILIYASLEYLIFKEIHNIYESVDKLNRGDLKHISEKVKKSVNPLRKMNRDIVAYANRKQREIEELKTMANFRREFIADISHELKTPLFSAQGFVLTLLDDPDALPEIRHKFLKKAAKSLDGLNLLVQDLITLSQIESGHITMNFEPVDLTQVVGEIYDLFEEEARVKNMQLLSDKRFERLQVSADKKRIAQVFVNLIVNAIKYAGEGTTLDVKFKVGKHKKMVTISVSDNGTGIPEADQARIFERFYRVEKSRSKKQGGSGLGLAIVKHIMEKHNSKISLVSAPGKGTAFTFELPLLREELKVSTTNA